MRRGLVVGKFMPFHRGHQLLVEMALAQVDQLTVIVYDSKVAEDNAKLMPADKRAGWITSLYPQLHNIVVLPDLEIEGDHDDVKYAPLYAKQVEFLGPFTHVFSSEDYGKPFADALEATHVTVDAARHLMPISGTTVRSDLYKYRAYVDPLVYRSLIQKVVFIGTESTGKSTISKALAEEYNTMHTEEYGRTLWEYHQERKTDHSFHDMWTIGRTQYEQEQAAVLHSNRYLFCDTNAFTTMLWSEMYYGTADQRLYNLVHNTIDEYLWFYCENDFPWVDDGSRELRGNRAQEFQNLNDYRLSELLEGCYDGTLTGSIEQRIAQVKSILGI